MRLQPYILSNGRAVPDNYLHVQLNDVAVDWFSNGNNYRDVVTQAADEAGGHAFATDFAGSTEGLRDLLARDGQFDGVVDQLGASASLDAFMWVIRDNFNSSSELLDTLTSCVEIGAAGIEPQDLFNCPDCYDPAEYTFDAPTCAEALDTQMIQPLLEADTLFDRFDWLTRLTSSISPAEMTVDPRFVINPKMAEVDAMRRADLVFECKNGRDRFDAPMRLELPSGQIVPLPSFNWMWENNFSYLDWVKDATIYAAETVEQTSADEDPMTITNNTAQIGEALAALSEADGPEVGNGGGVEGAGCGCQQGAGGTGALLSLGVGLLGLRRRQR
jgi:uncharacterized protein (TIGR03382 family)